MRPRKPRPAALELAIKQVGTISVLASALRLTPQAVARWTEVPPEHALEVERITGVSRYVLRPDIYGVEVKKKTQTSFLATEVEAVG